MPQSVYLHLYCEPYKQISCSINTERVTSESATKGEQKQESARKTRLIRLSHCRTKNIRNCCETLFYRTLKPILSSEKKRKLPKEETAALL